MFGALGLPKVSIGCDCSKICKEIVLIRWYQWSVLLVTCYFRLHFHNPICPLLPSPDYPAMSESNEPTNRSHAGSNPSYDIISHPSLPRVSSYVLRVSNAAQSSPYELCIGVWTALSTHLPHFSQRLYHWTYTEAQRARTHGIEQSGIRWNTLNMENIKSLTTTTQSRTRLMCSGNPNLSLNIKKIS